MPDELLTYEKIATDLGCTVRHVGALVKAGKLTAVPFGLGTVRPRKRVRRSEFERFLAGGEERRVEVRRLPPVPEYV